ncbi:MAG TPA: hypothetical protein VN943_06490 [Candidatus Acidoferrum sp.]|nr:hypothetical protein [Candidatus Acidoferrum sp.]
MECYAGYKGDERPVRLQIDEQMMEIAEVEDRWYSPGATYFRVRPASLMRCSGLESSRPVLSCSNTPSRPTASAS